MNLRLFIYPLLFIAIVACSKDDDGSEPVTTTPTPVDTTSLPSTYLIIDTDTFYAVVFTQQPPTADFYRYQINYTSREKLDENPAEPGANSILGLVMTFKEKPTSTTTYTFTDNRFFTDKTMVNFYLSYFINTGQPRQGDNFISPASGNFDINLNSGKFTANLSSINMSNEADAAETFPMKGVFDFEFN